MVAIAGNTLFQLATTIAQSIGPYQALALTSTGGSGTQVISTSAIDSEAPLTRHGGKYLYSHGPSVIREQQRVTRGGFVGSTGTFTVAKSYSTNPASGTAMSLLGTIPWIDQDDLTGLRTCINRSLRNRWVVDRYAITSTGNDVTEYDLGALWFVTKRRVKRLLDPAPASGTGHPTPSGTRFNVRRDGELWTLELGSGFPTGDVFYLEMEIPANARLYVSTVPAWAYTSSPTAAMALDDDACLGEWNEAYQCARYEVMKQLSVQAGGMRKAYWQTEIEKPGGQKDIVSALKCYEMDGIDLSLGEDQTDAAQSASGWGDRGFFSGSRW